MDLIIKAREVTVNITVQGFLKVVSANEKEIRFYISGEDNIKEASEQLSNNLSMRVRRLKYSGYLILLIRKILSSLMKK